MQFKHRNHYLSLSPPSLFGSRVKSLLYLERLYLFVFSMRISFPQFYSIACFVRTNKYTNKLFVVSHFLLLLPNFMSVLQNISLGFIKMEGNFEQYYNNNNSHTHNMFMRMSCFLIWHFNSILYYNFIKIHRYSFYCNPLYRLLLECKFPNPISFLYLWIPEKKPCLSLTWYHDYPVCIHNFYFPLNLLVLK